jgi:cytoskeletal protein CcmA (bactofilin family)
MWKKDDATAVEPQAVDTMQRSAPTTRSTPTASGRATIGPSITIHGEVSGDEDLLIQGKVEGSVELELHTVTVGGEGRVNANVTARVVTVEGEVEGDLRAREQVILRATARVKGDITAPRVVLEDGANFRGLVDMGDPEGARGSVKPATGSGASDSARATTAHSSTSSDASKGSAPVTAANSGKAKDVVTATGKAAS